MASYVLSVAGAILAAVEGGILPPGKNARLFGDPQIAGRFELCVGCSAGQDAWLYGRRDARRYPAKHITCPDRAFGDGAFFPTAHAVDHSLPPLPWPTAGAPRVQWLICSG